MLCEVLMLVLGGRLKPLASGQLVYDEVKIKVAFEL